MARKHSKVIIDLTKYPIFVFFCFEFVCSQKANVYVITDNKDFVFCRSDQIVHPLWQENTAK